MASKATVTSLAFLLALILFSLSSFVSSCIDDCYIPSNATPTPSPLPSTEEGKRCPRDTLKFRICSKLLDGPTDVTSDKRPGTSCCTLMEGLIDLEAAFCLCIAIKANIFGQEPKHPRLTQLDTQCLQ
ncbi:unnamed protein product [Citrullus colocynthis]|uniref:Hydrophobic seed protein domain-containing protein n=1 Tax=Citrullus colocynthis TaxID=252529 RepID=A0ABP0XSE9_9ROSI